MLRMIRILVDGSEAALAISPAKGELPAGCDPSQLEAKRAKHAGSIIVIRSGMNRWAFDQDAEAVVVLTGAEPLSWGGLRPAITISDSGWRATLSVLCRNGATVVESELTSE